MELAKEIKQTKPFRNETQQAVVNIMYTNNWLCTKQNKILKKYGISLQQYNVLRILKGHNPEPIMINGIIDRMLDKMSNASRLVDKLVQKGYVDRNYNEQDRRACDVFISEKGKVVLEKLNQEMAEMEDAISGLTEEEAALLNSLIDRFRNTQQ
ncbi:MAG: MarR family winged helix-turn-helix transcriptional regulator [Spirosomataceae bacterium]